MRRRMIASSPLPASPISNPTILSAERRLRLSATSSSTMRILLCITSMRLLLLYLRQSDKESCYLVGGAVCPDGPPVGIHDSSGHCESNARAGSLVLRFRGTIKAVEDAQSVLWLYVRSLVLHAEDYFGV